MLILMLKTDQPEAELYLYEDDTLVAAHAWTAERKLAETIHREIKQLLKTARKEMSQLQGIAVYSGPGSFTSLRIGHSVANALAAGLNLPIVQSNSSNWQQDAVAMLSQGQDEHVVLPHYGAPVHITMPRK